MRLQQQAYLEDGQAQHACSTLSDRDGTRFCLGKAWITSVRIDDEPFTTAAGDAVDLDLPHALEAPQVINVDSHLRIMRRVASFFPLSQLH